MFRSVSRHCLRDAQTFFFLKSLQLCFILRICDDEATLSDCYPLADEDVTVPFHFFRKKLKLVKSL